MSLLSAAMVGRDSSPMSHFPELLSIGTELEFGESGQSTHQLTDQADLVGAQWVVDCVRNSRYRGGSRPTRPSSEVGGAGWL